MPESDWYTFSRRSQLRIEAAIALLGGLFWAGAGLVGYDLGRRSSGPDLPTPQRWTGQVEWFQVVLGLAMIGWGLWRIRASGRKQ